MRAKALLLFSIISACDSGQVDLCASGARAIDSTATSYYADHGAIYEAETVALTAVSGRACRQAGLLRIRQRSGRVVEFGDTLIEGQRWRTSLYSHFDPALRSHVIEVHFYETIRLTLVPDSSGPAVDLDDVPLLSPDQRRFAVASISLESGYEPNSIDVWRLTDSGSVREFRVEGESWGPDSLTWMSPDSIHFLRTSLDSTGLEYKRVPQRLVLRDGIWRIVGPP